MALKKMLPADVEYLVVHCAATKPSMDIGAKEIDRWHRAKGWMKIGYHYVIARGGRIDIGRKLDEPGAHAAGYNSKSIGICLVGGIDEAGAPQDNFTAIQKATLLTILNSLTKQFPNAKVLGHRDLPGVAKACPSWDVRSWYKANT